MPKPTSESLTEDPGEFEPVPEWNLPTEPAAFRDWLDRAGLTLDEFKTLPAWSYAPASLRAGLE